MINILYDTSQTYSEAAGCGYYTLENLKYISKLDISNNFFLNLFLISVIFIIIQDHQKQIHLILVCIIILKKNLILRLYTMM